MRSIPLLLLLALPAAAEWQRHIITPKGERFDTASPHLLSYFTRHPSLRDLDNDICPLCSPEKRVALARKQKERAEVRLVGYIRGFAIYDVFYFFGEEPDPDWKSILVRTQPGKYREIWHYQRNEGGIWPSYLVKVGQETVLGHEDDCYKQDILQEYYWFGKGRPVRIDFSPIWKAAESVVPEGTTVWGGYDGRIDLPAGRIRVGLIREPNWRCCSQGIVEVKFELSNGQVVVKGTRLNPTAEFQWGVSVAGEQDRSSR